MAFQFSHLSNLCAPKLVPCPILHQTIPVFKVEIKSEKERERKRDNSTVQGWIPVLAKAGAGSVTHVAWVAVPLLPASSQQPINAGRWYYRSLLGTLKRS